MIDGTNRVRRLSRGNPSSAEVERLFRCIETVLSEGEKGGRQP